MVAAWRPGAYRSVGSMSGSFDERSFQTMKDCLDALRSSGPRFLLSCGLQEPHLDACKGMYQHLRGLGLAAEWREAPGGHDWPVWRALLGEHLRFHWNQLK